MDKYSLFQLKIWAEELVSGQCPDMDTPPGYAMFNCEKEKKARMEVLRWL